MKNLENVGLVLSGGGYRGAAHAGVIKALEELKITPDYISGASAGAIVGALYASGHSAEEILDFLKKSDVLTFRNYAFQKPGIFDSDKYRESFSDLFSEDRFEALQIPLFVAATDLIRSKTQFFYQGELIKPLIASSAIPGVFSPVTIGDRILCDGGVTNNFPVEPLLTHCDKIIGVYLYPLEEVRASGLNSAKAILERAYFIMRAAASERKFNECDVFIEPKELNQFSMLSKSNLDMIFELGYQAGKKKLEEFYTN